MFGSRCPHKIVLSDVCFPDSAFAFGILNYIIFVCNQQDFGLFDNFSSCNIIYIMNFCSVCERRRWGNVFPRVPTRVRAANYTKLCTALTPCIICRATSLVATFVKGSPRLGAIFQRHWRNPARWDGEVCFCALVLQIIYIYVCIYIHTHIYIFKW
jgi:hypothetical protein